MLLNPDPVNYQTKINIIYSLPVERNGLHSSLICLDVEVIFIPFKSLDVSCSLYSFWRLTCLAFDSLVQSKVFPFYCLSLSSTLVFIVLKIMCFTEVR